MSSNSTKNLFESMTRRRVSCPQITQQLWDSIKSIRGQRQVPTAERIQKAMMKEFGVSEEEVMRQLNHCVRDGLIEITKRTISKGNYVGSEQEGYKLPILNLKPDDFDWYCFDCHRAGDVICCSKPYCLRVYHLACISSTELPEGDFICHVCKMCEVTPDKFQMKKSKLNRLLGYTLQRLKTKYPLTLKDQRIPPPNKNLLVSDRLSQVLAPPSIPLPDENEAWRTQLLIAREMNLAIMEDKIDRHRYKLLEEFHVDALNIVHNMVIYNGVDSAVADIARQMLRDCVQDLHEIRQCVDCYKQSHGDKKKLWFCKPCRIPHELVYAKPVGFPYWPAKVIRIEDDQFDVRFFGGQHLRALIPRAHIRPISVNIHTLQVKRSSAWNKACEELKKHQEMLEKARIATDNFTKFLDSSSSSEYESVDSEEERKLEREKKMKKQKAIMEKHNSQLVKQKSKRRRSSSVASNAKAMDGGAGGGGGTGGGSASSKSKSKRARPSAAKAVETAPAKPKKSGGAANNSNTHKKKKKETYDFSSDSLDSFSFNNSSKNENLPKKNSDEIFDELLKSGSSEKPKPSAKTENGKTDAGMKEEGIDGKMKKWMGVEEAQRYSKSAKMPSSKVSEKKERGKVSMTSDTSDNREEEDEEDMGADDSAKRGVKKLKTKADNFDSSTMSSVETVGSKKKVPANKGGALFGLKEQNQNLSFEKIARSHEEGLKEEKGNDKGKTTSSNKVMKKIYSSSSEADDESDLSSDKDEEDSDYTEDGSRKGKSKGKLRKGFVTTKGAVKKVECQKTNAKDSGETSESEYERKEASKKSRGKAKSESEETDTETTEEDSSRSRKSKRAKSGSKGRKAPERVSSKGRSGSKSEDGGASSDCDIPFSKKLSLSKEARAKATKETSESTDLELPEQKKQLTRGAMKREPEDGKKGKGKAQGQKTNQKKSGKSAERKDDAGVGGLEATKAQKKVSPKKVAKDAGNSSGSEEALSQKSDSKKGEMAEMREMFKKYISEFDVEDGTGNGKEEKGEGKSCDETDSDAEKGKKVKTESESDGDGEEGKKCGKKKSKTELLEERVQKIKKQKNMVEDKKGRSKKASEDKEEMKEKEETIVSSSSQEPVTRSIAVQTPKMEMSSSETSHEMEQKAERIAELEKELQVQLSTNKMLEVELNKTRVVLDRMRSDHEDEVAEINSKHAVSISEIKKKQWCYNCETEAIYHCCWNTAYCSVECQQAHWQSEHKRVCRRKR